MIISACSLYPLVSNLRRILFAFLSNFWYEGVTRIMSLSIQKKILEGKKQKGHRTYSLKESIFCELLHDQQFSNFLSVIKKNFSFFLLAGWARLATIDYHSVRLSFSLQPLQPYSRKISLFPRLRETLLHGALFDTRRRHSTQDLTSPGDHLSCSKRKK